MVYAVIGDGAEVLAQIGHINSLGLSFALALFSTKEQAIEAGLNPVNMIFNTSNSIALQELEGIAKNASFIGKVEIVEALECVPDVAKQRYDKKQEAYRRQYLSRNKHFKRY